MQNADLNTLLRWATENTRRPEDTPTTTTNSTSITSHTSSPAPDSLSPTGQHLPPLGLTFTPSPGSTASVVPPPQVAKKLDTGVLDAIMGKSDVVRMRECLEILSGNGKVEEREVAGEELEELVQDLDNANDLEPIGGWVKLVKLLEDDDEKIVFYTCWIVGTAVQNNPKSQEAFLKRDPLGLVLALLGRTDLSEETKAKAMYCLSSTLKHAPSTAVDTFGVKGGWEVIESCLRGPSLNLRRKTAFLLNTLALQSSTPSTSPPPALRHLLTPPLLPTLLHSLSPSLSLPTGPNGDLPPTDEDYLDKGVRALCTVLLLPGAGEVLGEKGREEVKGVMRELIGNGNGSEWERRLESAGVGREEWKEVEGVLGLQG